MTLALAKADVLVEPVADTGEEFNYHVFVEGEPVTVTLRLTGAMDTTAPVAYRVYDYLGEVVAKGEKTLEPASHLQSRLLRLENLPAAPGWYRIVIGGAEGVTWQYAATRAPSMDHGAYVSYAVVPEPRHIAQSTSPFGMDVAMSSTSPIPADAMIRLTRLSGVKWLRDRISIDRSFPSPNERNWQPPLGNDTVATAAGLGVLQVFQDSPDWSLKPGDVRMTKDLLASYRQARELCDAFGPNAAAWEIWNEHDIAHFGDSTPDHYAAFLKAFSLGLSSGEFQPLRLLGPIARDPNTGDYAKVLFSANVAAYLDAYSYHSYAPIESGLYERIIEVHEALAQQYGFANKQIWMTETGMPFARNVAPSKPLEVARQQADYVVKSFALGRALGLDRIFWFLLKPYVGGGPSQFGLMRLDLTPFPYYSALATLTHRLGEGVYLGKLESEQYSAYLFADGEERVAIVWAPFRRTRTLPGPADGVQVFNVMGQPVKLDATEEELKLNISQSPLYLTGVQWDELVTKPSVPQPDAQTNLDLETVILPDIPAGFVDRDPGRPQENWDGLATKWSPRGYVLTQGQTMPLTVRVFNFGIESKVGAYTIEAPEGYVVEPANFSLTVEPMGEAFCEVTVTATEPSTEPAFFTIKGQVGERDCTPSVFQVFPKTAGVE